MADANSIAEWAPMLGVGIAGTIAGIVSYFRKPKEETPNKDVAVVAATLFSDRKLMVQWMDLLHANTNALDRNNELLIAEAQRRHDDQISEQAVRDYLTKRGIRE